MRAIAAILGRNLLNFVRDKGRLFGTLIMAFAFLFIFSFVMKSSLTGVKQPMNYLISGIIIMTVFQASLSNSTDILTDIASGFMKEILVAPISRAQISIGQILSSSVIAILQGLIICIISLFMGLSMDAVHFIEMIGIMAVAGLTFGSIGLFLATIARNSAAFQIITMIIVMPLTFLSGAYIPTTIMPAFLRPIIYINPLTYITSIFRYITLKLDGTPVSDLVKQGIAYNVHGFIITPALGFFIILLIGLVFFSLCVHKFNKADFSNVKVARHH
jgi:ABC-type polysaccharide/polyol phosphate export systems, permease component